MGNDEALSVASTSSSSYGWPLMTRCRMTGAVEKRCAIHGSLFRAVPLPLPAMRSTRSKSECYVHRMDLVRRSAINRIDAVVRLPSALRHRMIGLWGGAGHRFEWRSAVRL